MPSAMASRGSRRFVGGTDIHDYAKARAKVQNRRMPETVGFIGLGLMGRPMAKNLLKAGYTLVVNSRSQGPVDDLVAAGATRASTPADAAANADVVITMVPDGPDVELVLEGPNGAFSTLRTGAIVIDMSSI